MSKKARPAIAIKRNGRKFVVIHSTVARLNHVNVPIQLVKRAGKVQWFVAEGKDKPVRYACFWSALKAYNDLREELKVPGSNVDLSSILELTDDEAKALAQRLEVDANAQA